MELIGHWLLRNGKANKLIRLSHFPYLRNAYNTISIYAMSRNMHRMNRTALDLNEKQFLIMY